jgi:cytoskeletal protein CcmA (bactofilin family)
MEDNKRDLKIMGSGDSSGGVYNNIFIGGSGDINGDVECNSFKIMGSGDLHGNLKASFVKISGSGDIHGNVTADDIIFSGSSDINGDIKCKTIKITGSSDMEGNIYAEEMNIMGSSDIDGNCEAEIFSARGAFQIDGLLNAGEINIELKGSCEVKEIGGEKIEVRRSNNYGLNSLFKGLFSSNLELTCEVIEGDDIYLEYTTADIVRGTNIVIGCGCEIGKVEYRNEVEINENKDNINLIKL